jgi:hypothetical protein
MVTAERTSNWREAEQLHPSTESKNAYFLYTYSLFGVYVSTASGFSGFLITLFVWKHEQNKREGWGSTYDITPLNASVKYKTVKLERTSANYYTI